MFKQLAQLQARRASAFLLFSLQSVLHSVVCNMSAGMFAAGAAAGPQDRAFSGVGASLARW